MLKMWLGGGAVGGEAPCWTLCLGMWLSLLCTVLQRPDGSDLQRL